VLTRSGWLLAAGSAVAAVAGWLFGTLELSVLAAVGATLVAVALAWVRRPLPEVVGHRRPRPARPTVGRPASIELAIQARDGRALPVLTVVDPVAGTVGARVVIGPTTGPAPQEIAYRLPTTRRGRVEVGPLSVERVDPLALARRRVEVAPRLAVTVLPHATDPDALPAGDGRDDPLDGASQRALAAVASDDLATLRPYVVGDDLRRVHWPSSAHADTLLVRRDEERWQGQTTVLVDCREGSLTAEEFEAAVSGAAGLVHALADAGDRVRLVTTGGLDSTMVDARRSEGVLFEELALVTQHRAAPHPMPAPHHPGREALVVVAGRDGDALAQAAKLAGYGSPVVWSYVRTAP
jgi:uncharacterized protein (DUF58 family)